MAARATPPRPDHLHLQGGLRPDALRLRRGAHRGAVPAGGADGDRQPAERRQRRQPGALSMRRPSSRPPVRPATGRAAIMIVVSFLMLIPFYWVVKTSLTGENIYAWPPRIVPVDPHLFNYVDVWYMIPLRALPAEQRHRHGHGHRRQPAVQRRGGLCAHQAFPRPALGRHAAAVVHADPFQATIIPAYLITSWLGVLDTGWASPCRCSRPSSASSSSRRASRPCRPR